MIPTIAIKLFLVKLIRRVQPELLSVRPSVIIGCLRLLYHHATPPPARPPVCRRFRHALTGGPSRPRVRAAGFQVSGRVATRCSLAEPLTGELRLDHCGAQLRSIDLQVSRVTCRPGPAPF